MMTHRLKWLTLACALLALACSRATEPELEEEGRVVLRFEPPAAPSSSMVVASSEKGTAAVFDSVIVRVFRPGSPIVQEKWAGAQVGVDPVEMSLSCIAEADKRISVELFYAGLLTHHGFSADVDVSANKTTPVTVHASQFYVESLSVTPGIVANPTPFDVAWTSAPAADWYHVQSSTQPNFADIEWEESLTDTFTTAQLAPGMHYFRVIPQTQFASGLRTGPEGGYVTGGSGSVQVTGFTPGEAIPTETFTILGENLDFPGTRAFIGADELSIISATWGSLEVRLPRAATTNLVSAGSLLGSDTSANPFVVQRVAFVTSGGDFSNEYLSLLKDHWDDFGYSGVAVIPVTDLDTRSMGVFDIVIVADDTGSDPSDWGDGVPTRAFAISASTANVLALGEGGLAYLQIVIGALSDVAHQERNQTSYYVTTPSASIFQAPHPVIPGGGLPQWFDISSAPKKTVGVDIASGSTPPGFTLHACTGLNVILPNDLWAMMDIKAPDVFSGKKHLFYWGHADDPKYFTTQGQNLFGNVMYLLHGDRAAQPGP
jgi:hypothetical protein